MIEYFSVFTEGVIIIEEKKVPVVDILQVEHAVSNESVPKPPVVKSPPKEKPEETPKPSNSLVGHAVIGRIEKGEFSEGHHWSSLILEDLLMPTVR